MKPPNAIAHMTLNGLRVGAIRGALFGLAIVGLFLVLSLVSEGLDDPETLLSLLFIGLVATVIGGLLGGSVGLSVGFLSGFALDWLVRRLDFPLSEADLRRLRGQARLIIAILCGLGALIAFVTLLSGSIVLSIIPALICLWSMLGVADKYLKKLAEWEKPKNKIKKGYAL